MTRTCFLLILTVVILAFGRSANAQDGGFAPLDWRKIDGLIDLSVKTLRAGATEQTTVNPKLIARVTPGIARSKATGAVCDECRDFCREFTLEVERDGGFTRATYRGQRCITVPSRQPTDAPWADREPMKLLDTKWLVAPEMLSEARGYLVMLKYMMATDNTGPQDVMSALDEFRADAGLAKPRVLQIGTEDLRALRDTASRSKHTSNCAAAQPYAACGEGA